MRISPSVLLASSFASCALAAPSSFLRPRTIVEGSPDSAPSGYEEFTSPIVVPSPNVTGSTKSWASAVAKARLFTEDLSLEELVNLTTGVGFTGRCTGQLGEVPRKNFPALCMQDGPTGVRDVDRTSSFPAAINAASTFDKDLIYHRAAAIGEEFRGKGINVALAPMMNAMLSPASGRNWEGSGGDPYLSGVASALAVKGIQDQGVIACAKHYIGNEQDTFRGAENTTAVSSNIDDRTLHEIYLWPFAESVRAGVGSVMCSYQKVNQTHSCENSKLMNGILKDELNFSGFVVSDWFSVTQGVEASLAGLDVLMPGLDRILANVTGSNPQYPARNNQSYWGARLVEAVNNGSVPISRVRDQVTRTVAAYYKLNQDSADYPEPNFNQATPDTYLNGTLANEHVNVQADHYKIIREVGAASTVLLKNVAKTLPLDRCAKDESWAIFGSDAGPAQNGPNAALFQTQLDGTLSVEWGSGATDLPYIITPAAAIDNTIRSCTPNAALELILNDTATAAITQLARRASKCLVFVTSTSGEAIDQGIDGQPGDRNNLTLWNSGEELIQTVAGNCSNTIVVIHAVGPVLVEDWIDHVNVTAVIHAGLPGQESGNSLVDVMFGKVSPSGRLPFTVARNRSDYAADVLYEDNTNTSTPQINYSQKLLIDYRWFDANNIEPRFEFGFGLSFTTFGYSNLSISTFSGRVGSAGLYEDIVKISYVVENTGQVNGHEVSQVYLGFPENAGEPPKVLRGFERTFLSVGNAKKVTVAINKQGFSIWNVVTQAWEVPEGDFRVFVGASSRDLRLEGEIKSLV